MSNKGDKPTIRPLGSIDLYSKEDLYMVATLLRRLILDLGDLITELNKELEIYRIPKEN